MKLLALTLLLAGCSRAPLTEPAKAFLPATPAPALRDAYPIETLREALGKTLRAYESSATIPAEFRFADRVVTREDYRRALEALLPELESFERFHAFVKAHFDFHPVYGDEEPGEVFSTGYYDATMPGSRKPQGKLTEPIYRAPDDMVTVDLKAFADRFADVKPLQDLVTERKTKAPVWRGRLVNGRVIPYYQRSEIQRERPLSGRGLELAYVDPIDAFFLEIQGSGVVELPGGKRLRVGYDGQNGYPYAPIGKFLWGVIPKEQMSMQRIRRYLETLPRDRQQEIFDKNPSFVFFQELKGQSLTYSGAEVTPMRTVASDRDLFPKGTLGFLDIELPVFADADALDPSAWEAKPRWVLDQDTGGAIRGGGRIDLYMGRGEDAERVAGVMKRKGHLWVAVPKEEFVRELRGEKEAAPLAAGR
jgi:membrane-bound lytic murein transglycosylase A